MKTMRSARREEKMALKTETSPRTEAAPFSDRESSEEGKRSKRSNWGGDPCSPVVEPSTAENVHNRGRDLV